MTCNASDLVNAAKCYCFPKGMAGAIQTYLLCKWAQIEIENPPPPCEFSIALDGPGRVILSWGNPVVYDLIEVWHAPLFGPRHLETTLPGTDTSWTTPILAPGDYFIIRGKIGDDYSGFATGDTCPPIPGCVPSTIPISWSPPGEVAFWIDGSGAHNGDLPTFLATASIATVFRLDLSTVINVTSVSNISYLPLLDTLNLDFCPNLSTIDIRCCKILKHFTCEGSTGITSLDFTGCDQLIDANISTTNITGGIDLSNRTGLTTLSAHNCPNITSLSVAGCSALTNLNCNTCNLGTLNITGDFAITSLDFSSNPAVVIIGP